MASACYPLLGVLERLDLWHNLDVMHIEKNICDSIMGTLLNIEGKTKDTFKSRIDLTHLGIRKDLQVQDEGEPRDVAPAVYVLNKVKRKEFCEVLSRVRFPHGFASNPERRVSADGNQAEPYPDQRLNKVEKGGVKQFEHSK